MNKKVAIIGSGTAGATSAIYLNKLGYRVTIFEREIEPKPVGAGIMLQPTGLNTLADLGLAEKALALGTKIIGMDGSNTGGKKIVDISFKNEFDLFGLGIHRGALYFILYNELKRLNIPIKLGCEINDINNSEKQVTLYDTNGQEYSGFDWVIVANGARSLFREQRDIIKKSNEQKFGAIWAKIPFPNDLFNNYIHQRYKGSHKMIGFMPIGKPSPEAPEYVNFFWSINMSKVDEWKNTPLETWKKEAIELAPDFKEVIEKIESKDELVIAPYMDVVLKPSFDKNIVFIGDSAHPMSPQLAQGASFAMLDARVLVEMVEKYPEDLPMAFVAYHRERSQQVKYFQKMSRRITPMFQSENENPWIRDTFMNKALKRKIFKKLLVSTILGYRQGIFSNLNKKYFTTKPKP
jgi:2-polyprenyl-6-methoxyphenol hydroxylase-like FAD-dependent oxidoreductase